MSLSSFRLMIIIIQLFLLLVVLSPIWFDVNFSKRVISDLKIAIMWFATGVVVGLGVASILTNLIK